tara:strand:- start:5209 stop:5382 length:174 start_codon:yes stop_codon:yes gene_type:complete
MNDEEIEQFVELMRSYMIRSELEIIKWNQRQEYYNSLVKEATKMQVTVDYYKDEFLV